MNKKIKTANFHFKHVEFKQVSEECKDLITKLLTVDVKKRITGKEALSHPWFKKCASQAEKNQVGEIDDHVIERLRKFKGETQFKRAALNMLVKMSTDEEMSDLKLQFEILDEDRSGMILASELSKCLQ